MKILLILIGILFSITISAQEPCIEGFYRFTQKNNTISMVLIRGENIFPYRNIQENMIFSKISNQYLYSLDDKNKKDINSSNVSTLLKKTKASLSICFESYKEQIKPFLKKEINEVTLISKTGVPFLTFTRTD